MSSINIYTVLEKFRSDPDPDRLNWTLQLIDGIAAYLREAEKSGYLGTLYRTDFEVKGADALPIDMLRYTSAWPKGETDAQAIEDSLDSDVRATSPRRGPRTITLSKYHRDPEPQLAADRWEAKFRWRVVRVIETVAI